MSRTISILPLAFLFTGAVTLVDRSFNAELLRLSMIRESFLTATQNSRHRLLSASWMAIQDTQVTQNLEMGNLNTVSQSLQSYIRPGELDQIELLDQDCNLAARIPQNSSPIQGVCQAVQKKNSSVYWQRSEQKEPVLVSVIRRELAGKSYYLATQLGFDQAWASLYPKFNQYVVNRDVNFSETGNGAILWREGKISDGRVVLPLRIDGWLYRFVPEVTQISLEPVRESFWILYGALGVVMMLVLTHVFNRQREEHKHRERFEAWLRSEFLASELRKSPPTWEALLEFAQVSVRNRNEKGAAEMRLLRDRIEHLSLRVREKETELSRLEDKMSSMSDLASLKEQIETTTSAFIRQVSLMRDDCENLVDIASNGIAKTAKQVFEFSNRWKTAIGSGANRDITARRFFKSMIESRDARTGSTKLDEELLNLEQFSHALLDQALNVAVIAQQATVGCEDSVKIASLWHGIALRDHAERTTDWVKCIMIAQQLIQTDQRFYALTFETLPQIEKSQDLYPPVSESALVSGFFHLYRAILEEGDITQIQLPIVIRQKRVKEQVAIIVSLPMKAPLTSRTDRPAQAVLYHLDLAKQIFKNFDIQANLLPQTVAGFPMSITWEVPQKTHLIDLGANELA